MSRRFSNQAEKHFRDWFNRYHTADLMRQAEQLAVRRDMVTLLSFVHENKVVGTQSTGNMPLKMVRAVTAQFVNPPVLDNTIGDKTYHLRTEENVWPLYFLHILAEISDMLITAPSRRWRVTENGLSFLSMDPILQTGYMLTNWWFRVNWAIAFPVTGLGDGPPSGFNTKTLAHLRQLMVGQTIPFEPFADKLVAATGLTWGAQGDFTTNLLRTTVERLVINILKKFEAVTCAYVEKRYTVSSTATYTELDSFAVTPFGQMLLEAVGLVMD
jgi:hypothetical protein